MAITATVELPVESKDPRDVVQQWVSILKSQIIGIENLEITASIGSMANRGVLNRLAERLSGKALGFSCFGSSDRAKTADEFLADSNPSFWIYQGMLTQHLSPPKTLALIEELILCPPQAVRSASFMLDCQKLQWKNSLAGSSGFLHLFDFKGLQRKQRFSLTANLRCPGQSPKSPEVVACLRRVFESTGIPFHKGRICAVPDEEHDKASRAKSLLIGQICFDETVEEAADAIDKQSGSQWTKTALSHSQAFSLRAKQWGDENSERVNLPAIAKRIVKTDLPELMFESSDAEEIWFKKSLTADAETLVCFSRSLPRLGKAFTLVVGVRAKDVSSSGIRFKINLFRLERTTEERSLIYSNRNEAEASVRIGVEIIKNMLPAFESAIRSYFSPWPKEYPKQIKRNGSLTAKQAFELALPYVQEQLPDAQLIQLCNSMRSLEVRDTEGSEISMAGCLQDNGMWWLHFYSKEQDKSIEVHVPAIGRIRILDHGDRYKGDSRSILAPITDNWIDSNQAFAIAEKNGGQERRGFGHMFGVSAKLNVWKWHSPFWELLYLITDERGRIDFTAVIDACSGEFTQGRSR